MTMPRWPIISCRSGGRGTHQIIVVCEMPSMADHSAGFWKPGVPMTMYTYVSVCSMLDVQMLADPIDVFEIPGGSDHRNEYWQLPTDHAANMMATPQVRAILEQWRATGHDDECHGGEWFFFFF